jgi:hypothetical protein
MPNDRNMIDGAEDYYWGNRNFLNYGVNFEDFTQKTKTEISGGSTHQVQAPSVSLTYVGYSKCNFSYMQQVKTKESFHIWSILLF